MILSRIMREQDYPELEEEGKVVTAVHDAIQMWNPAQHKHRLWEYTMAVKALRQVFGDQVGLEVTDHGCGAGYLSPMLSWLGYRVTMYEVWVYGNEEPYMMEQMRRVAVARNGKAGLYRMVNRPLCELVEEDRGFDASFCISTLEHIGEYQRAFRDLLQTVKVGGLVFLTTDFGEHETDDYQFSYLRAGKMFTQETYRELLGIAQGMGFELLGGPSSCEWKWDEECRIVYGYGFGSMALLRERG